MRGELENRGIGENLTIHEPTPHLFTYSPIHHSIIMNQPTEPTNNKLEESKQKCEEYLAGWQRAQADYQNLQKEHQAQMKRLTEIVNIGLLEQLLPVIDHYELAVRHVPENQSQEEWVQGFYHIKKQFDDFLAKNGLKRIAAVGEKFDTHRHEAIGIKDGEKDNEVLEEIQAGYALGDYVLRHAKVIVSKGN